ncbi:putative alcohol O-acetyltransferase [Helianthus annuus]|nr:putative alcohol O-acetyltransferase [Helianthus annuus]KAJ0637837.1 putative alcohol O-acetyltransferase [Helianthus annuus]
MQVTELKCGGIVIGCMFDHRAADGYSANMFISTWAEITRSEPPSMLPSFQRSILKPRCPTTYSPSIGNVFALFEPPTNPEHDHNNENGDHMLINRVYYIEGEQLDRVQLLASENGQKRSKLEAFTSFLWKIVALSMEDSDDCNKMCNVALAVDGRSRLSQGDGEEKEKLMVSHFGNVLSMPSGSKRSKVNELTLPVFQGNIVSQGKSILTLQKYSSIEPGVSLEAASLFLRGRGKAVYILHSSDPTLALLLVGFTEYDDDDDDLLNKFGMMIEICLLYMMSLFYKSNLLDLTHQELKEMSLSSIATEVHDFLQTATTKDHFLDLIDWVEERRLKPLVAIAFASKEMSVMVSSGTRFHIMDKMDFGWGKVVFGSCHVPSDRTDCYVMTLPSPTNNNDWIVYMHLPMKHMNYIESHASHMFKPLNADYLKI